jgi:hypothetical protein
MQNREQNTLEMTSLPTAKGRPEGGKGRVKEKGDELIRCGEAPNAVQSADRSAVNCERRLSESAAQQQDGERDGMEAGEGVRVSQVVQRIPGVGRSDMRLWPVCRAARRASCCSAWPVKSTSESVLFFT